jgi:hypothetical protein
MYEVLKKIQVYVARIKARVDDHDQHFIAMREQIHGIHRGLQTQNTRFAKRYAAAGKGSDSISHDIDRIKRRLEPGRCIADLDWRMISRTHFYCGLNEANEAGNNR